MPVLETVDEIIIQKPIDTEVLSEAESKEFTDYKGNVVRKIYDKCSITVHGKTDEGDDFSMKVKAPYHVEFSNNSKTYMSYDVGHIPMNVYVVSRPVRKWCEDHAMVVIAKDEKHAERKARWSSEDFKKCKELKVKEIYLYEEQCVLIDNTGG